MTCADVVISNDRASGSGGRIRTYDQAPRSVRRASSCGRRSVEAIVSCTVAWGAQIPVGSIG
jgi:hypothetical protein